MVREELSIWNTIWRRLLIFIRAAGTRAAVNALFGFVNFSLVLVIDLIAKSLPKIQGTSLDLVRTILLSVGLFFWSRAITPFIIRYRDLSRSVGKAEASVIPVKVLRWFAFALAIGCIFSFLPNLFTLYVDPKTYEPKNPNTVTSIDVIGMTWLVGFSVLFVGFARFLFLWQRTVEIRRRYLLWIVPIALFSIMQYLIRSHAVPEDTVESILLYGLRGLVVFSTLFLWFRIEWIPHISRSERNRVLIYSGLSALLSLLAFILYLAEPALLRFTDILQSAVTITLLAFTSYFGLIFFNALFTLSSSELVERRAAEVKSLAKLTRFSSDVLTSELLLDIPRLADQITSLAREATKSDCAWLELKMEPVFGTVSENGSIHSYNDILPEIAERIMKESSQFVKTADRAERPLSDELALTLKPVLLTTGYFVNEHWLEGRDHANTPKQLSSIIAVPLLRKDELRGALYVAKQREYGFDDEDVTVLTAFSDVASLALDTARLLSDSIEKQKFDGELRAARAMQKTLLPDTVPNIPGFELSAISIPAYEVGGDYYDFSTLWDSSPIVVIGDVSGKGISASIFMAETKGIVQALAPMMMSLRELFIGTNDALMRNLTGQGFHRSFVTLSALSFKGNSVKYARGGHMPLLKLSPDGKSEYLQPKGMGVGFVGKAIFDTVLEETEIFLERGDLLVLYSDGITEIRSPDGDELGYERFADIVAKARLEGPDTHKMIDHILRNVLEYAGSSSFHDDATFVVIRKL
jgi:serine phosphatase RsbU (regulator of sigma subunit)